jgi:uncharacterized SAM-binding protein YcdF (DUF218 family)
MFLFKKIVSQFFFPMPLCLFLCFTGLALLWWTKKQKAGRVLVSIGVLFLTALSCQPVADTLLAPLERKYPPYVKGNSPPVKYVVVLGGGHNSDPSLPAMSQIGDESLKRLAEGIRIQRENPGSKLLLSGGGWLDPVPNAKVLEYAAELLGVSSDLILLETESKDTEEEASLIKNLVKTNSFVLVTSANHMPRSMSIFSRQGLRPEPAPTDHLVKANCRELDRFFPSSRYLRRSERVFYELMGSGWGKLTGRF